MVIRAVTRHVVLDAGRRAEQGLGCLGRGVWMWGTTPRRHSPPAAMMVVGHLKDDQRWCGRAR